MVLRQKSSSSVNCCTDIAERCDRVSSPFSLAVMTWRALSTGTLVNTAVTSYMYDTSFWPGGILGRLAAWRAPHCSSRCVWCCPLGGREQTPDDGLRHMSEPFHHQDTSMWSRLATANRNVSHTCSKLVQFTTILLILGTMNNIFSTSISLLVALVIKGLIIWESKCHQKSPGGIWWLCEVWGSRQTDRQTDLFLTKNIQTYALT